MQLTNDTTMLFHSLCCSFFPAVFGEDVAFGGVFRCTEGLQAKYGQLQLIFSVCVTNSSLVW